MFRLVITAILFLLLACDRPDKLGADQSASGQAVTLWHTTFRAGQTVDVYLGIDEARGIFEPASAKTFGRDETHAVYARTTPDRDSGVVWALLDNSWLVKRPHQELAAITPMPGGEPIFDGYTSTSRSCPLLGVSENRLVMDGLFPPPDKVVMVNDQVWDMTSYTRFVDQGVLFTPVYASRGDYALVPGNEGAAWVSRHCLGEITRQSRDRWPLSNSCRGKFEAAREEGSDLSSHPRINVCYGFDFEARLEGLGSPEALQAWELQASDYTSYNRDDQSVVLEVRNLSDAAQQVSIHGHRMQSSGVEVFSYDSTMQIQNATERLVTPSSEATQIIVKKSPAWNTSCLRLRHLRPYQVSRTIVTIRWNEEASNEPSCSDRQYLDLLEGVYDKAVEGSIEGVQRVEVYPPAKPGLMGPYEVPIDQVFSRPGRGWSYLPQEYDVIFESIKHTGFQVFERTGGIVVYAWVPPAAPDGQPVFVLSSGVHRVTAMRALGQTTVPVYFGGIAVVHPPGTRGGDHSEERWLADAGKLRDDSVHWPY